MTAASLADLLFAPDPPVGDGDPVLYVGDEVRTWGDLRARAEAVAAGVEPGRPVPVMLPNGAELVATLFGVWRGGGVYVPLNPRLGPDDLAHARADAEAAAADLPPDAALIQFTSGTTGWPKPVVLTHGGVLTLLDGVIAKLRGGGRPAGGRPPMPNLIPVSLSLWAGIYNVLFALRVGAPVVVMDGFDPVELATLVRRHDIRSTVLPPAAMVALVDDPRVSDLAPLRYVRSITAPLSPLQARRFRDRFGIAVLNSYGQTEIGGEIVGWNAADSRDFGEAKLGSVGRPHAGVEVRTAASGELEVRTPARAAGDLSDRLTPDGWFRTGDVGRVDGDGFVWVEGRLSDMINRGGLKVHPDQVEEVLRLDPGVADAAVVGVPDDRLGEVPVAFVVPAAGRLAPTSDGLSGLCRAHLAPYKVPVRFEVVDALPRNEVGKLQRALLKGSGT
ncbi:MAG TPA: AMP-binding protein [Acidimicrobiales bacterium]|nr:AMP-binding protein [Acidimicrobiales bacterium]